MIKIQNRNVTSPILTSQRCSSIYAYLTLFSVVREVEVAIAIFHTPRLNCSSLDRMEFCHVTQKFRGYLVEMSNCTPIKHLAMLLYLQGCFWCQKS